MVYEKKVNEKRSETKMTRSRWRFGACPRCKGAMHADHDDDFSCFNCGYIDYNSNIRGGNNGEKEKYQRDY
jgi:ribosomal protein S27AE